MEYRPQPGPGSQNLPPGSYEQDSPTVGPYQYYEPPARKISNDKRRSFSERTAGSQQNAAILGDVSRSDSRKAKDLGITGHLSEPFDESQEYSPRRSTSDRTHHTNNASSGQPPLRIDPNAVPSNIRSKPFSPELKSPRTRPRQPQPINAALPLRQGSVSDRSPLQQLEQDLVIKEQKRAKVQQAEERSRQKSLGKSNLSPDDDVVPRQGARRAEKERAVTDGRIITDAPRDHEDKPRHSSAGLADGANRGERRIHKPQETTTESTRPSLVKEHSSVSRQREAESAPVDPEYFSQPFSKSQSSARAPDASRNTSGKSYTRDAAYASGAAIGAAGAATAAERGKAAHERRKSQMIDSSQPSPISPATAQQANRSSSNRIPRSGEQHNGSYDNTSRSASDDPNAMRQPLRSHPVGSDGKQKGQDATGYPPAVSTSRDGVMNSEDNPIKYRIPPQTEAGKQAREQVGFGTTEPIPGKEKHRFGGLFHRDSHDARAYVSGDKPLKEWQNAETARLKADDLEFNRDDVGGDDVDKNDPWWVKPKRRSISGARTTSTPYDGPYEEEAKQFNPPLFTKCGPLLRYTGMRKESAGKEVWRGSVMVVTDDALSDYSTVPTLRIFAQPMELLKRPPHHLVKSGMELPPEYDDPVAGQVKLSRTGRPLYVRPVGDIDGEIDLSREENPQGLYAATRTPVLGPQSTKGPDGRPTQHISFQDKSRIGRNDGEKAQRFEEVKGARLHVERGFTFWRFNLEIELGAKQQRVAYRINHGPAIGFWVPARDETMNIMFHSCNGFSMSVDSDTFSGPDPMWRDVMNQHQSRPFHVMLGGGDQIYNDAAMRDTQLFKEWLQMKNPEHKHHADFSIEMQVELELFYLDRYCMWFSQGLFAMANSQIPMVNIYDDHDIIDGFGSYPHHFMSSPVFAGLGNVAFKYYMLFQHQSTVAETQREEPSWVLGASPGPYINQLSRSVFVNLGRKVALLAVDCRTERMRDEILSQESYDILFDRCRSEINKGQTKHLIVLLGVPIAYPRLNFLENILTSRLMDPIKAIGRTGMLGGFVNKFDGGVEILDDLDDHWTAKHHKAERNWFIQELQELAAERSVRVTILGGDVHLGAVGQFYTPKKFGIAKDKDHRYMPNIVSSAIVNTPPPPMMADVLNKRNKVHHLDHETDEDMIPMFDKDVDGTKRNNNHLLPRRNYCTIREYVPGSTPPSSPRLRPSEPSMTFGDENGEERVGRDRKYPPGSMKRTMSLTRGPANLMRRLSGSRRRNGSVSGPNDSRPSTSQQDNVDSPGAGQLNRSNSLSSARPVSKFDPDSDDPNQKPSFHRRPTNLSVKDAKKAAAKGGPDANGDGAEPGHINLEYGLDISLNMEIDQKSPAGRTAPYRMLVPALWYEGEGDLNTLELKSKRPGLLKRLTSRRGRQVGEDGRSRSPSRSPSPNDADRDPYASRFAGPGNDSLDPPGSSRAQHLDDDEYDSPDESQARSTAHHRGYGLFPPPIGAHSNQELPQNGSPHPDIAELPANPISRKSKTYSQPSYRRTSGPNSPAQPRNQQPAPRQQYDGPDSDDSLTPTPSGEMNEPRAPAPDVRQSMHIRRPSKVEKLLGVGDQGTKDRARAASLPQNGNIDDENIDGNLNEGGQRKRSWKIWK